MIAQACAWCKSLPAATTTVKDASRPSPLENDSTFKQCQGCFSVTYCSPECEAKDTNHHTLCATYKTFIANKSRPSTSHKLALLLPDDADNPQFIWLKTHFHESNWESPNFEDYQGPDHPTPHSIFLNLKPDPRITNANFQTISTLIVDIRADSEKDGSLQNRCIELLFPSKSAQQWRGPVVISLKTSTAANPGISAPWPAFYSDFHPGDLHRIRGWFKTYRLRNENFITGVRIRCLGEVNHLKKPTFALNRTTKEHTIFSDLDIEARATPVSIKMGVPLVLRSLGEDNYDNITPVQRETVETDLHFHKNPAVMYLTLDTNTESKSWGELDSMQLGDNVGTVIIARLDKKPLSSYQVEALVCYCRHILYPNMQKLTKEAKDMRSGVKMKRLLGQKSFEMYFEELSKVKQITDPSWAQAKSIYST